MSTKSDFMAAEELKAILQGRDKTEQERIIRWVAESLGLPGTPQPATSLAPTAASGSAAPAPPLGPPVSGGRSKDIKTFVGEKNPKSDIQFAAVAAYFYRFEAAPADRKDAITAKDLQESGRQARGCGFTKPIATLSNALKQGYFDRAGRGEFRLNAVGENLVAMTLPGGGVEVAGTPRSRSRRKQRNKRGKRSKA